MKCAMKCAMKHSLHTGGRQAGFAYIAAIVLLVVMASLAAAVGRLNSVQLSTSSQDLLAARGSQAARAGVEWGLAQLRNDSCEAQSPTLEDFRAATGFRVTVRCVRTEFNEGERNTDTGPVAAVKRIYQISATACNRGATCPDDTMVTNPDYVERRRVATACLTAELTEC